MRRSLAGRFAFGLLLASLTTSGVLVADSTAPPSHEPPAAGVERRVPAAAPARTGTAAIVVNRPAAPVGDPEIAVDPEAVLAIAAPAEPEMVVGAEADVEAEVLGPPPPEPPSWFLVGDSTFFAAAQHLGTGSAIPGVGFAQAPFGGAPNPLFDPPADSDGVVVIGVSIWDVGITDPAAYVRAVEHYRTAGRPVLVVGVPEGYGPGDVVLTTAVEAAELRALNDLVDGAIACPVAPWTIRDVEALGDVDDVDDHVHPTATGVDQLFANLAAALDWVCPTAD